eukprot:5540710-Amphidinium_carterae.1
MSDHTQLLPSSEVKFGVQLGGSDGCFQNQEAVLSTNFAQPCASPRPTWMANKLNPGHLQLAEWTESQSK